MKKKLKGISLIELIVSIAVSTVIFVGVTGLLLFLKSNNDTLNRDSSQFYNGNTLSHAIEYVLDEGNNSLSNLPTEKISISDEKTDKVEHPDPTKLLFTITKQNFNYNYYFIGQHFGYALTTTEEGWVFVDVYVSQSRVKLEFEKTQSGDNEYLVTLSYGSGYSSHFSIYKDLYVLGGSGA